MISFAARVLSLLMLTLTVLTGNAVFATPYTWNVTGPSNWNSSGNWSPVGVPGVGDSGAINSGTATANAILTGSPTITVGGTGKLVHPAIAGTTPISGTITVQSGGTMDWTGNSADLTSIIFEGGSFLSRSTSNSAITIANSINLQSGVVTAANFVGTVYGTTYSPIFTGPISGSAQLYINPSLATQKSSLTIGPSVANAFNGSVVIAGNSTAQGTLILKGTGALQNVSSVTLNPYGVLRINTATDPLPANLTVNVPVGARMEWGGTGTYSYATANLPKIVFANGSDFGREDANVLSVSRENIQINSGNTVYADKIRGTVSGNSYLLTLAGPLTGSGNLIVQPYDSNYIGTLQIAPTTANSFNGTVTVDGSSSARGTLALGGTGALRNITALTLTNYGALRFNTSTDSLPDNFAVNVPAGGRVEWSGSSTYTSVAPTINFGNNATISRVDANAIAVGREKINIAGGVTVIATDINGSVYDNTYALTLAGPISGSGTLRVAPTLNTHKSTLRLAPTSANAFNGNVEITGNSNVRGYLSLAGTGALANVNSLTLDQYAALRFNAGTDPLPSNFLVNVPTGAGIEWAGTSTYTVTPPTLQFQDETFISRSDSNSISFVREKISLVSGATVHVKDFSGSVLQQNYGVTITGPITGDDTTTLHVKPSSTVVGNRLGVLTINPTTPNSGFAGNVVVESEDSTYRGVLILNGNQPLGSGTVDILNNSIVSVGTNGALNGVTGVNIENGGSLRFRVTGGSTLNDTELTGNGLIRSESTLTTLNNQQDNYTLQPLVLLNTVLSPGNSAGTLTFQATTLTLGAGTVLKTELGLTSDLIAVQGNAPNTAGDLVLSLDSVLELSSLGDLTPGNHVIATYGGTLTGEFGSIINNLSDAYVFNGINYGTGINSFISIDVSFAPIPEPNSGILSGLGLIGAMVVRRKKRIQK